MGDSGSWKPVALLLCSGPLVSCASAGADANGSASDIAIRPLARIVDRHGRDEDWDVFYQQLSDENVAFDDAFRSPYWPVGATVVDCADVSRLGVVVRLYHRRALPTRQESQATMLRFRWTRSVPGASVELSDGFDGSSWAFLSRYENWLDLDDWVDGTYTVSVSHRGEPVYGTSFALTGCAAAAGIDDSEPLEGN